MIFTPPNVAVYVTVSDLISSNFAYAVIVALSPIFALAESNGLNEPLYNLSSPPLTE